MPTAEICRKHGIRTALLYSHKAKFGRMEFSDASKLKAFGDKNTKLKKLQQAYSCDVGTSGNLHEPEETLTSLSGRKATSMQAWRLQTSFGNMQTNGSAQQD